LIETEKNHVLATALLAIEKSTNKNTIADSIVTEMVGKFGGNWYSSVTSNTTTDSGSALKLQSNQLIRFSYETYVILVFKLSSETNNTRTHVLAKINAARNSNYSLVGAGLDNATRTNEIMAFTTSLFKNLTVNFDRNTCLSYAENSVPHVWDNRNCYYRLSIDIFNALVKYNVTDVSIGESTGFSNYNYGQTHIVGYSLSPLTFVIHTK